MTLQLHDYRQRLIKLNLSPLMYQYNISDILFLIKSLKSLSTSFKIINFIAFFSGSTRLGKANKMKHTLSMNSASRNSFFNRIPRLWNAPSIINLDLSIDTIKIQLKSFLFTHFLTFFDPNNSCFLYLCSRCHYS